MSSNQEDSEFTPSRSIHRELNETVASDLGTLFVAARNCCVGWSSSSSSSSDSTDDVSDSVPHVIPECEKPRIRNKRRRDSSKRCSANVVDKKDAPWQRMLDLHNKGGNTIDDEKSNDGRYFRRRFRVPYSLFQTIIAQMLSDDWFPGFGPQGQGRMHAIKLESNRGASLQVMVLSCLRILGRGVAFDECFDGSGCKEECIRVFFHKWCPMFVKKFADVFQFSHSFMVLNAVTSRSFCGCKSSSGRLKAS